MTGIKPVSEPNARTDKVIHLLENSLEYPFVDENEEPQTKKFLRNVAKGLVEKYIQKYSEKGETVLGNSVITTATAYYIAAKRYFGKSPSGTYTCRISQREIAANLGITEASIRNRYKDISETLDLKNNL